MGKQDSTATVLAGLIKDPLLLLGTIGLAFCLVGALGYWPGSHPASIELPWRLGLAIVGLVLAAFCLPTVVRKAIKFSGGVKPSISIEGKYYAEGNREYVNTISRVSDNIYRIRSHSWEGVGFVVGNYYYGIYKYSEHPDTTVPGNWGAHRAEIRIIDELPLFVIELSDKFDKIGFQGRWERAEKADVR